jgi:hypothetical protein
MDFRSALVYSLRIYSRSESAMRFRYALALVVAMSAMATGAAAAQGFRFSQPTEDEEDDRAEQEAIRDRIARNLSVPCRASLKDKKIMVVIGERRSNGFIDAKQQNYGPHYQAINKRLRALGLRTYTPEEIRKQIEQAEIEANLRNDPEAARTAAKRLGASFVLRGLISTHASRNPVMAVNQVSVDMGFTLSGSNGSVISDTQASSSSYAGSDVARMALTLVNEKADEVVAELYADYCSRAPPRTGRPDRK